jgi:hypothetical protein
MNDTPVGIADVVRAADALRLRGTALEAAVAMCGFWLTSTTAIPPPPPPPPDDAPREPTAVTPIAAPSTEALPPSVRRLDPARQATLPPQPADPLAGGPRLTRGVVPSFVGLFDARDTAELLRLAASVPAPTDRIDVQRVIDQVARALPMVSLPTLTVPSLGLGAQVLVDIGVSMLPFWDDQQALVEQVRATMGELADVRYVADDPTRGAGPERRRRSWTPYQLPRPETPVIAVTDLGCGFPPRARSAAAWRALALRLRRRQSRLLAFAPVRLARVPRDLRQAAEILVWDRRARRRNLSSLVRALDG